LAFIFANLQEISHKMENKRFKWHSCDPRI